MLPHHLLIQSCYPNAELSESRLNITSATSVLSLKAQTLKPALTVTVHPDDPHLERRMQAFESTGCECRFMKVQEWKLYGENYGLPEERKVVSRCDDDDFLAVDFIERVNRAAIDTDGPMAIIWPNGYVYWRSRFYFLKHPRNQFVSTVGEGQLNPHQMQHQLYIRDMRHKTVTEDPGWVWVRHSAAWTSTLSRWRAVLASRVNFDFERIPISIPRVQHAIETLGSAPSNIEGLKKAWQQIRSRFTHTQNTPDQMPIETLEILNEQSHILSGVDDAKSSSSVMARMLRNRRESKISE